MLPRSYSTELSSVSLKPKEKTSRVALTDKLEQDVLSNAAFRRGAGPGGSQFCGTDSSCLFLRKNPGEAENGFGCLLQDSIGRTSC